jgi:hypothetical protein
MIMDETFITLLQKNTIAMRGYIILATATFWFVTIVIIPRAPLTSVTPKIAVTDITDGNTSVAIIFHISHRHY